MTLAPDDFAILPQPDETTCGPTCLQAVYQYYGDTVSLETLFNDIHSHDEGGTLAVFLGTHALKRGYQATIYTYNIEIFDPTWFKEGVDIKKKLRAQARVKNRKRLTLATRAYLSFLQLGGKIKYEPLKRSLLKGFLARKTPILTGLSATYLFQSSRDHPRTNKPDDLKGVPAGHFVVIYGYDEGQRRFLIADPYVPNPFSSHQRYSVDLDHLVGAIYLGILTYDANLLIIEPGD